MENRNKRYGIRETITKKNCVGTFLTEKSRGHQGGISKRPLCSETIYKAEKVVNKKLVYDKVRENKILEKGK